MQLREDDILCFCVQGTGDLNAVDVAQEVHEAVLRQYGTMRETEVLRNGEPMPSGPTWDWGVR